MPDVLPVGYYSLLMLKPSLQVPQSMVTQQMRDVFSDDGSCEEGR
jgi:hypothetical protein